jgi:hypothetical protein
VDVSIEAVSGIDRVTVQSIFHHRLITHQKPDSRTGLTCRQVTGGKYPFFVTKVQALPVD